MTESPFVDSSFAIPVFSPRDDLIAYLNKAIAFLTVVASLRFPSTNNQLRISSNPRNQATIQDGRVIVDNEASYHKDASDNGTATNKPKQQQQQQLILTTTTISNIKLPILKKEEYDIWPIKMEHCLEYIDNDVWKYPALTSIAVPMLSNVEDKLEWHNSMGELKRFSVREIWNSIRPRSDVVDWYNVVWFPNCIPSHAFHLWLVAKRRLKTQDRLRPWDLIGNTMPVWYELKDLAGLPNVIGSISSIVNVLIPIAKRRTIRSVIAKLVVAASSYYIWQERNSRLFTKKKRTHGQLTECIKSSIRLKLLSCVFKKSKDALLFKRLWDIPNSSFLSAVEIHAVEKERKARTILLMAIPKEHLRRFHGMDDAKEIWEAIRTRFGGNANSKKMQKAVLKQQFEAFTISKNGNSWVPIPVIEPEIGLSTATKMTVPSTAEEKTCKKNDVKSRSLLLMALPNEHQLTFDQYVDAQSMFAAIKARFGGNEATKKIQKAMLKQQYENFNALSSELLDSIFNRLQKLVSRLGILGVVTPPEDLNVKFLRSLPSEWDTHVVVWMNKPDFDTMGLDDLYNNFKIVEEVYAFLSTQPQGSQLVHEDLEQLHDDDLEEMDLKWNMALLSMRARKFYQRTGRKIIIDGSNTAGYDKSKVECFNCHKMGHFARECRAPRSKDNRNWNQGSSSNAVKIGDASEKAMCAIDGVGFDWSDTAEEEIQANMALMAFSDFEVTNDKSCSKSCLKNYEALKKQYDDLLVKLDDTGFKASTYKRGLSILEGQILKYKEHEVLFSEEITLLKRSIAKDLDQLLASQITDKSKKGFGYNVVPSPHPLILNRPTPLDLSYSGLEEFKEPEVNEYGPRDSSLKPTTGCDKESDNSKENTDDSLKQQQKTDSSSVKSPLKVDKDWKEKFFCPANHVREEEPKKARENNDAPIIEDWVSDDEDDDEPNPKVEKKTVIPTATKKEFVKPEKPVRRSVSCPNQQRKRIVSGNNYNKKDNDYYSKTSHSSAHKHMAPRAVLMKTGLKSVNTARPVNTVSPGELVDVIIDDVTEEEYERINEELYGDVNVSVTDVKPVDKEKNDEDMTVASHVNINQEGAVPNAVKEYLRTSLDDALYKVLKKDDADIIKEHSVLAEIIERLSQNMSLRKALKILEKSRCSSKNKPLTPDSDWNVRKTIDFRPPQTWISKIAQAKKPPLSFDELMSTPIDFSAYVINHLKIDNLTQEHLVGPAFNLLKGTCKSRVEHEYNHGRVETVKVAYDINVVLGIPQRFLNDNVYGCPHDIEDMLLLFVQKKLSNLERYLPKEAHTKPQTFRSDISNRIPYTAYSNPQEIIYEDKYKRNRLMRTNELYKFSDETLTSVRTVLHDIALNLRMDYLPMRRWSNLDRWRLAQDQGNR
ncbi:ribonuclease H-like domain-containing protein [Tanacetum coccineum]|uniref:Ribonuclease H-like domain-containing protein n=1 Tax=Tanacetum coccineum TaxID=301880 RepID=A0ABQ5HSA2_9ASTR